MDYDNKKTLVVYDFDWSLVDDDSDEFLISNLSSELLREMRMMEVLPETSWPEMMSYLFAKLHALGTRQPDFERVLKKVPLSPSMIRALEFAHSFSAHIYILSDANTWTISQILHSYNIQHLIDGIISNPAEWDEEGKLKVKGFVRSHGCQRRVGERKCCTRNLCKGEVLRKLKEFGDYTKIVYVGDGKNDFCAACQLESTDILLCRRDRVLHSLLTQPTTASVIQAKVAYFSEAPELLQTFQEYF